MWSPLLKKTLPAIITLITRTVCWVPLPLPMPVFYNRPESLDDAINHSVDHVLNLSGLDTDVLKRWQDLEGAGT